VQWQTLKHAIQILPLPLELHHEFKSTE
jgi:hypothetical protein